MFKKLLLILFVTAAFSNAGRTMLSNDFSYSVPHYSVTITDVNMSEVRFLEDAGFLIEWAHGGKAMIYVDAQQEDMLRHIGFAPVPVPVVEPLVPYPSLDDIYASIDAVVAAHPDICRKVIIGTSVQSRPIVAVVVSDNVLTEEIDSQMRERFQSTWSGCLGGAILEDDYWQTVNKAGFFEIQIVLSYTLTEEELKAMACCPGEEFTPAPAEEDIAAVQGKVISVKFTATKPSA